MIHYPGSPVHPIPIAGVLPTAISGAHSTVRGTAWSATPVSVLYALVASAHPGLFVNLSIKTVFVFYFGIRIHLGVERHDNPILFTIVGKCHVFEV